MNEVTESMIDLKAGSVRSAADLEAYDAQDSLTIKFSKRLDERLERETARFTSYEWSVIVHAVTLVALIVTVVLVAG
jgi:hypothetical protein